MKRWICLLLTAALAGATCSAETVPQAADAEDAIVAAEVAPQDDATPEPVTMDAPAAQEPSPEVTQDAATDDPDPEGTAAPDVPIEPQSPEESQAPEEPQTSEESQVPEESQPPLADDAAEQEPAPEGYLLDGSGAKLQGGALEELLQTPGALRICISTRSAVHLADFPLARLMEIEFVPDPDFSGERLRVLCAASERVEDEYTPEILAALPADAVGDLYIRLLEIPDAPEEPPVTVLHLRVSPEDYRGDVWSCVPPTFTLGGIGAEDADCAYAAIILDERIAVLSDSVYIPREEGAYSVRFVILDAMGDVADRSERYDLRLDYTPPELGIEVSQEADCTMALHFSDALSGVEALSLDGGASWIALDGVESYIYTAPQHQSFAPETILLRDAAGNLSSNAEEILLDRIPQMSGGGGGGSGEAAPKKQHASGDGSDEGYNVYELALPDAPATALTLGGEEVALTLGVEGEGGDQAGFFTASLLRWARSGEEESPDSGDPDTLLLAAEPLPADDAGSERVWRINGAVLRKLYNSDIRYLLLEVDGAMLSLPTQGFLAGTRYAQLKMQGVSTAEFDYEIRMRTLSHGTADAAQLPAFSRAPACDAHLRVQVEGEEYAPLDRDATPEMYLCDVYLGPEDLPDYPYGAYPAFADGAETEA